MQDRIAGAVIDRVAPGIRRKPAKPVRKPQAVLKLQSMVTGQAVVGCERQQESFSIVQTAQFSPEELPAHQALVNSGDQVVIAKHMFDSAAPLSNRGQPQVRRKPVAQQHRERSVHGTPILRKTERAAVYHIRGDAEAGIVVDSPAGPQHRLTSGSRAQAHTALSKGKTPTSCSYSEVEDTFSI